MSRWYLTSDRDAQDAANRLCEAAGLTSAGYAAEDDISLQSYLKRADPTPTFVDCGANEWICSAGTVIYGGKVGPPALRAIHADYAARGVGQVRSNAIGHYALALRVGNQISVFTDPQGALNLYYRNAGSSWMVSNSLQLCGGAGASSEVDRIRLTITALETCTHGERTLYTGVRRLFGSQRIIIDVRGRAFHVERIPSTGSTPLDPNLSFDEAVHAYVDEIRQVFGQLVKVGPIGILGTGGLDSRTVLAGVLDAGGSPEIMYGVGTNGLIESHPQDLEAARALADSQSLPFRSLNWFGRQPFEVDTLRALFSTYGFKYEIYGASEGFMESYNEGLSPDAHLFLGGYTPVFTNRKPWEIRKDSFKWIDLMEHAIVPEARNENTLCRAEYEETYAADAREGLCRGGIQYPEEGASLDQFVRAYLFLRLRPEARYLNFANEFVPYVAPFLLKRLYEPLVVLPPAFRVRDKFQVRIIESTAPQLLGTPLFSGHMRSVIDRTSSEMTRYDEEQSLLARVADLVLPPVVRRPAKRVYRYLFRPKQERSSDRSSHIKAEYGRRIMDDPILSGHLRTTEHLHLKMVERLMHYLVGVKSNGYAQGLETAPEDEPRDRSMRDLAPVAGQQSRRIASLDAFRGTVIAAMILVNNPGDLNHVYAQFAHMPWNGWTLADLVAPAFLWIIGVTTTLSLARRLESSSSRMTILRHITRRSALIFLVGVGLAVLPALLPPDWSMLHDVKLMSILQRIAVSYCLAAAISLWARPRTIGAWALAFLAAYWILLVAVPLPGGQPASLEPGRNLPQVLDLQLLGVRSQGTHTLLTIPSVTATVLIGALASQLVRIDLSPERRALLMGIGGTLLTALGLLLSRWMPINRHLWTPSFCLFTAGGAMFVFAGFYWALDVKGIRRGFRLLIAYGANPIFIFALSEAVSTAARMGLRNPSGIWRSYWTIAYGFVPTPGDPRMSSLLFGLAYTLLFGLLATFMYKRRWIVKI